MLDHVNDTGVGPHQCQHAALGSVSWGGQFREQRLLRVHEALPNRDLENLLSQFVAMTPALYTVEVIGSNPVAPNQQVAASAGSSKV
jgi:hypothetical protein